MDELQVGPRAGGRTTRPLPPRKTLQGRYRRIEPLAAARHAERFRAAFRGAETNRISLPRDPPGRIAAFEPWLAPGNIERTEDNEKC